MKSLATVVGAVALLALAPAVRAAPITYTIDTSSTFIGDTFMGTFTFDSSVPSLLSVDITVTGSFDTGVYTVPQSATAPGSDCTVAVGVNSGTFATPTGSCLSAVNATSSPTAGILIEFANLLSTTSDPVAGLGIIGPDGLSLDGNTPDITGAAVPAVPEPASLALFGAGLAGFAFFRRRRNERRLRN